MHELALVSSAFCFRSSVLREHIFLLFMGLPTSRFHAVGWF